MVLYPGLKTQQLQILRVKTSVGKWNRPAQSETESWEVSWKSLTGDSTRNVPNLCSPFTSSSIHCVSAAQPSLDHWGHASGAPPLPRCSSPSSAWTPPLLLWALNTQSHLLNVVIPHWVYRHSVFGCLCLFSWSFPLESRNCMIVSLLCSQSLDYAQHMVDAREMPIEWMNESLLS